MGMPIIRSAQEREGIAAEREHLALERERLTTRRQELTEGVERWAKYLEVRTDVADRREALAEERERIADEREALADELQHIADERERSTSEREADGHRNHERTKRATATVQRKRASALREQAKVTAYHEKLSQVSDELATLCGMAGAAMQKATEALLQADLASAEEVIRDHDRITTMLARTDESTITLLALQQPVAGELRSIVSWIHIIADVDRMGALAVHVAKIVRRRHPDHVLPAEVEGCFSEMGSVAGALANSAKEVLSTRDPEKAARLRKQDDEMDALHRNLFGVLMDRTWTHGARAAVDVALLGRFYERFADHAVQVGRRVVFQVTGVLPPE
jgi:phosphate transport system protein